jgi:hypothetical protein
MRDALHRERGDQDGERDLRTEHRRRSRDLRDVDQHAGPELAPLEGGDVVAQRDLVAGAAGVVGERARVELLLREALVVPDVDRLQGADTNPRKRKPASESRRRVSSCRGYEGGAGKLIFAGGRWVSSP